MGFLSITKESIEAAKTSGLPVFEDKEKVVFLVEEVKKDDEKKVLIFGCKIIGGKNDGRTYSHYIRENGPSMGIYLSILGTKFSEAQLVGGQYTDEAMIGCKMESVAKVGPKYTNFYEFAAVSDVPEGLSQVDAIGVPESTIEETADDGLF